MSETADIPEVPEPHRELSTEPEVENMRSLKGWAYGTIAEVEDGDIVEEFEAWIETFDGNGRAGVFEGVRFMAADEDYWKPAEDGGFDFPIPKEAYAACDRDDFETREKTDGFYVKEYLHGENPGQ